MDLHHILQLTILDKQRHEWYDRTIELADMYFRFVTGVKIDELLKRFVRREGEEEFKQRKRITQQITPAIANKINKAFKKVHRSDNINKAVKFDEEGTKAKDKLIDLISRYRSGKSLNNYLVKAFDRYNMIDPNAYLVNTFEKAEVQSEPNQPVGIEFISQNVLNYEYKNDVLQWIVLRDFIEVPSEKDLIPRYQLLATDVQIVVTPITKEELPIAGKPEKEIKEGVEFLTIDNRPYQIIINQTGLKIIPAIPFGFKEDFATNGETFVSIWHEALPYFWKSLKVVSEFDLTTALVAFPLRSQYVGACTADQCNNGHTGNGEICEKCDGTGNAPILTSAQEVYTIKLPEESEDIQDISKFSSIDGPPVDLVKWQQEYIKAIEADALSSIFNSEIFVKNTVVNTATEQNNQKDNINDPLLGYAEGFSDTWKFIVRSVAEQASMSVKDLTLAFEFPKDFRFETIEEIIATFKAAVDAGAPPDIKGSISRRLAQKEFIDDPNSLKEFEVKQQLNPFPNESRENVERKIALGLVPQVSSFTWANFDDILCQIKIDDPEFFFKKISEQKRILKEKAEELDTRNPQFDVNSGG